MTYQSCEVEAILVLQAEIPASQELQCTRTKSESVREPLLGCGLLHACWILALHAQVWLTFVMYGFVSGPGVPAQNGSAADPLTLQSL
jgi:hypothetical protein